MAKACCSLHITHIGFQERDTQLLKTILMNVLMTQVESWTPFITGIRICLHDKGRFDVTYERKELQVASQHQVTRMILYASTTTKAG